MKKKKDTTEFDKQKIQNLLYRAKTLVKKMKETPYYYNQHPIECVKPLIDIIGNLLTEYLNQKQDDGGVYRWYNEW